MMWMAMNSLFRTRTLASRAELVLELIKLLCSGGGEHVPHCTAGALLTKDAQAPGRVRIFIILATGI
jgi:hypothetical protein